MCFRFEFFFHKVRIYSGFIKMIGKMKLNLYNIIKQIEINFLFVLYRLSSVAKREKEIYFSWKINYVSWSEGTDNKNTVCEYYLCYISCEKWEAIYNYWHPTNKSYFHREFAITLYVSFVLFVTVECIAFAEWIQVKQNELPIRTHFAFIFNSRF